MMTFSVVFFLSFFVIGSLGHLVDPPSPSSSGTASSPANVHDFAVSPSVQTAAITHPAQQSDFDFDMIAQLPVASPSVTFLTSLPANCAAYLGTECNSTMSAANVTYDDCGDPWTICRCSDANMTMDDAVDMFARVPVGLRRYVGTVSIMADTQPHAYTLTTGDIHIFDVPLVETWLHESTHAFDYKTATPISASDGWLSAVLNDSCVPDTYSQTNAIEDFAQMSVIKFYELTHGGALPDGFSADCMHYQLAFMDSLPLYNTDTLFGNTCNIPDASADGFDMNQGAKNIDPPAVLNMTKTFPLPYTNTPTPSGFKKVVATSTGGVLQGAAGGPPSSAGNRVLPPQFIVGTLGIGILAGLLLVV